MPVISSNISKLIIILWLTEAQLDFSFFPRGHHNILEMYKNTFSIPVSIEHFSLLLLLVVVIGTYLARALNKRESRFAYFLLFNRVNNIISRNEQVLVCPFPKIQGFYSL